MSKMWAGRTSGITNKIADDFNSSISFDSRMYKQDIIGSIAHTRMLSKQGIISPEDATTIIDSLTSILDDIESGKLKIDYTCEDIHMFVEMVLTERIGDVGKKLHTARSRNDQVALDTKLYLKEETAKVIERVKSLIKTIANLANDNIDVIMPGYTHLQRAQPILFSHHILAYSMMFIRDLERFKNSLKNLDYSPIGSCALSGTTFNTDRQYEAELLGFLNVCENSIDGVSDRDYCVEFISNSSLLMMHMSRMAEELILWSSWEFKFIEISDLYTTGSSIMPQKKNPDMAELIRGKTGRVYGNLMALLTVLKGLPLAYNKDMQEDKESVFDTLDTINMCLDVLVPMISSIKVNKNNTLNAAKKGFINATDMADYLVRKGLPFRTAYKISGEIVSYCIENDKVLETLSIEEYKKFNELFENDIYENIDLKTCIEKRVSYGGTSTNSVKNQLSFINNYLLNND